MRNLAFLLCMAGVVPLALARPFVGVLLWSWISFMNPHQEVWGIASALPWATIVFCATIFGCMARGEPRRFPHNATVWLIITFVACISLTSLVALAPPAVVEERWESVGKVFLFLVVTAALVSDKYRIHALLWIMVISVGYYGVRGGVFTLLTGGKYRVFGPPGTVIGDNNTLAVGLLIVLPLMNYLRLQSAHRVIRVGLLGAMLLTLFAIIGSYSRGALIGLGAVAVFLAWKSSHRFAAFIVLALGLAAAIAFMPPDWMERMSTIQTYQADSSAESRLAIWRMAIRFAMARPWTGAGFMSSYTASVVHQFDPNQTPRAVHSIYLEVLGDHGFPTFVVWFGITLVGIANSRRIVRATRGIAELAWARDLAQMAQVSIIAYLVGGAFLSLSYWDFYFTMLVAVAATRERVAEALAQIEPQLETVGARMRPRLVGPAAAPALLVRPRRPADG